MHLTKVVIKNLKCFQGEFSLDLESGLNILVGDNEAGKSTILEAIHLALSGWIYGKYITNELTQALFNTQTVKEYINSLKTDQKLDPPNIFIELFIEIESDWRRVRDSNSRCDCSHTSFPTKRTRPLCEPSM